MARKMVRPPSDQVDPVGKLLSKAVEATSRAMRDKTPQPRHQDALNVGRVSKRVSKRFKGKLNAL